MSPVQSIVARSGSSTGSATRSCEVTGKAMHALPAARPGGILKLPVSHSRLWVGSLDLQGMFALGNSEHPSFTSVLAGVSRRKECSVGRAMVAFGWVEWGCAPP